MSTPTSASGLSPQGIPYMFRFATRQDQYPQDQKKWIIDYVDRKSPYLGLRAQLSQVLFNPMSIGCLVLVVLLSVVYRFACSLLAGFKAYATMQCLAMSMADTPYGAFYQQSSAVMGTLNSSIATAIQQYEYTMNASMINLMSSTGDFTHLMAYHYQVLQTGAIEAAYAAAENTTEVLGGWAAAELESAQKYTQSLLNAIQNAVGSLGGSTNLTSNITTNVPMGLNTQLTVNPGDVLYNVSMNAALQLDIMFTNFSTNFSSFLAQYSGLATNLTFLSSQYSTNGCDSTAAAIDKFSAKLAGRYRLQMGFISGVAVLFMAVCGWYLRCKWNKLVECAKRLQYPEGEKPTDSLAQLNYAHNLVVACVSWILDRTKIKNKVRVEWAASYLFSSFLIKVVAMGWCAIIAGLLVRDIRDQIGSIIISYGTDAPAFVAGNSSNMHVDTLGLNMQVTQLESSINTGLTDMLTALTTDTNSLLATLNTTLYNSTLQALDSINTTYPTSALNFSLVYSGGIAVPLITLPRVDPFNISFAAQGINLPAYGVANVTAALATTSHAFTVLGASLLGAWVLCCVAVVAYIYIA